MQVTEYSIYTKVRDVIDGRISLRPRMMDIDRSVVLKKTYDGFREVQR